jgi:hypothetical protein
MKKGLFSVFRTRATVGFAVSPGFCSAGRLHAIETATRPHSKARIRVRIETPLMISSAP